MMRLRWRAGFTRRSLWIGLALAVVFQAPAGATDWFVFPNDGQSQEQLEMDEFQCTREAQNRTGFDPMAQMRTLDGRPQPQTQGSAVGGAARGALLGTVGGAIAGNTGRGAAIGAATGGLMGGMRNNQSRQQQSQWRREAQAQQARDRDRFTRAFTACMEARGYTVR